MTPGTRATGKALDGACDHSRKDNKRKGRKAVRAALKKGLKGQANVTAQGD